MDRNTYCDLREGEGESAVMEGYLCALDHYVHGIAPMSREVVVAKTNGEARRINNEIREARGDLLHIHNVWFNVTRRRRRFTLDPSQPLPLAGTVFDPRRYPRIK